LSATALADPIQPLATALAELVLSALADCQLGDVAEPRTK